MAHPSAPMQRQVPVGYRFWPTEEELVSHYLHHKLMGHDPSLYNTIPEIDVCKYEPGELLACGKLELESVLVLLFQAPNSDLEPLSLFKHRLFRIPGMPLPTPNIIIAEATMADPTPTERHMPVGYRFHPTEQELVGHYLRHKLMADDPSIDDIVPEIGSCKYEPWDLLAKAVSAAPATKFDDFQCYFFCPRDYKYSKGKRINRTTPCGFWKVTCADRRITERGTNNVIGKRTTLVFHIGCSARSKRTNWVIHQYYNDKLPIRQRTHVLCWLRKKDEKKIKDKTDEVIDGERESMLQNENQTTVCMNLNENYSSNACFMIQPPSQLNEATDSMIQPPSQLNEATDSMIQPPSQLNEATDSMIQPPLQLVEVTDSMIQPPFQLIEAIDSMVQPLSQLVEDTYSMIQPSSQLIEVADSMIQPPSQLIEVADSMIQPPSQLIEVADSMIQPTSQLNEDVDSITLSSFQAHEAIIQPTLEANEAMNSMIHTPPKPNYADEPIFDEGEVDLASLWQLPPAPSIDEGLFEIMPTSDMHCREA